MPMPCTGSQTLSVPEDQYCSLTFPVPIYHTVSISNVAGIHNVAVCLPAKSGLDLMSIRASLLLLQQSDMLIRKELLVLLILVKLSTQISCTLRFPALPVSRKGQWGAGHVSSSWKEHKHLWGLESLRTANVFVF